MSRFVSLIVLLVACGPTFGQLKPKPRPLPEVPNEKPSEVFEDQEWYYATASGGTTEPTEHLYQGPSEEAANAACERWKKANKATKPNWITNVSDPVKVKVPVVRSTGPDKNPPGQIGIAPPKPFVDPGPLKKPEKKAPDLKGKKAPGEIGDLKVTFEFTDGDKLDITGDATGSGTWKQEGTALYMETKVATYRGTVTEAGAAGLRFWKDGSKPIAPWHVDLRAKPAPPAASKFVGAWGRGDVYHLYEDGSGEMKRDGKPILQFGWKYVGRAKFKNVPREGSDRRGYEGTWEGDSIEISYGGKKFTPSDKNVKYGFFQLGDETLLVPDGFYDGRDWRYKVK